MCDTLEDVVLRLEESSRNATFGYDLNAYSNIKDNYLIIGSLRFWRPQIIQLPQEHRRPKDALR